MRVSTVAKLAVSCLAVSLLTACPKNPSPPDGGQPPGECRSGVTMTAAQAAQEKFVKVDKPIAGEYVVVLHDGTRLALSRGYRKRLQHLIDEAL